MVYDVNRLWICYNVLYEFICDPCVSMCSELCVNAWWGTRTLNGNAAGYKQTPTNKQSISHAQFNCLTQFTRVSRGNTRTENNPQLHSTWNIMKTGQISIICRGAEFYKAILILCQHEIYWILSDALKNDNNDFIIIHNNNNNDPENKPQCYMRMTTMRCVP